MYTVLAWLDDTDCFVATDENHETGLLDRTGFTVMGSWFLASALTKHGYERLPASLGTVKVGSGPGAVEELRERLLQQSGRAGA